MDDPISQTVRTFFSSKIGAQGEKVGFSLNFDPTPIPISVSALRGQDGKYDVALATEFFALRVANHAARIISGSHFKIPGSLADVVEFNLYSSARFYPRFDLSEASNDDARKQYDVFRSAALSFLQSKMAMAGGHKRYFPSTVDPVLWGDSETKDLWSSYKTKLVGPDRANEVGTTAVSSTKLPMRRFDPRLIRDWQVRTQPPIPELFPKLGAPKVVVPPPPQPWHFGLQKTPPWYKKNQNVVIPEISATKFSEKFLTPKLAKGLQQMGAVQEIPDSFHPGQQMMMSADEGPIRLDDLTSVDATVDSEIDDFRNDLAVNAVSLAESDSKDFIDVEFDYLFVTIDRPWIFIPFLNLSSWYIPGAKRGDLSEAGSPDGLLSSIPHTAILVRNLRIRTRFTDQDQASLQASFAIGPFALTRSSTVSNTELREPGMQVLAYLDYDLPHIPPRSDPSFAT